MIRGILACDEKGGIGKAGTLPWPKNAEDLKWFKTTTQNSIVMMGRNTWDDPKLPKPLPNRYNIVVSDKPFPAGYTSPNIVISRDKVKTYLSSIEKDIWVIGGSRLFAHTWLLLDEVWISSIKGTYNCDSFIPSLEPFRLYYETRDFDKNLTIKKYRKI